MPNIYVKGHFVRKLQYRHTDTHTADGQLHAATKVIVTNSRFTL